MNTDKSAKIKQDIKMLTIIWYTLTGGLALFLVLAHFVLKDPAQVPAFDEYNFLSYFSYLLIIAALPGGYYIFDLLTKKGSPEPEKNMQMYRTAILSKYAVFEFAGFFSVAVYIFTAKTESIYAAAVVLAAFLINKPAESSFYKTFEQREIQTDNFSDTPDTPDEKTDDRQNEKD